LSSFLFFLERAGIRQIAPDTLSLYNAFDKASRCGGLSMTSENFPSSRRTSPVSLNEPHHTRIAYAVDTNGGRNSAISRKTSPKSVFEMATSVIWKAT
jgi:hypothetical protein